MGRYEVCRVRRVRWMPTASTSSTDVLLGRWAAAARSGVSRERRRWLYSSACLSAASLSLYQPPCLKRRSLSTGRSEWCSCCV